MLCVGVSNVCRFFAQELEHLKGQHQYQQQQYLSHEQRQSMTQHQYLAASQYQRDQQQNSNYTTTWQERRSARVEKQELLQLQFELVLSHLTICILTTSPVYATSSLIFLMTILRKRENVLLRASF